MAGPWEKYQKAEGPWTKYAREPSKPNPDGTYGQPPEGMFINPETGQMTERSLLRANVETKRADAAGIGVMQGLSAGFGDEVIGLAGRVEGGPEMQKFRTEQMRAKQEANREDYPGTMMTGEIAGAVAVPVGAANTARGAAAIGGGFGALSGMGNAEGGISDRGDEALKGAATGALIGYAGSKVVQGASRGLNNMFAKSVERPTVANLKATKSMAYRAVDEAGETFTPQEMSGLFSKVKQSVSDSNYVAGVDKQTGAMLNLLDRNSKRDISLGRLDKIRQDLWKRYRSADNEVAILDGIQAIDDLIASRADSSDLMNAARLANSRFKKAEMLDLAFQKAQDQTASTGSGGNILNKYRQAVTSIINNESKSRFFSPAEIGVMREFVHGSASENIMRRIGKLAPGGNGLMSALNLFAAAVDPTMLAATGAASAAKGLADRSAQRGAERVQDVISGFTRPAQRQVNTTAVGRAGGYLGGS